MSTTHSLPQAGRGSAVKRVLIIGSIGGMVAGMMMAMVEMLYGWASSAHTFWDAPMAIWAWVGGRNHFGAPGNHVGPIILGLGGHMMNSMTAGVMFAALATGLVAVLRRRRSLDPRVLDLAPVMLGVAYGLAFWAVMRYGVLPLRRDREAHLFTQSLVSPQWVWWLAHAVLGMTAGMAFDVARRVLPDGRPATFERAVARAA
jgi:hypothetical protein